MPAPTVTKSLRESETEPHSPSTKQMNRKSSRDRLEETNIETDQMMSKKVRETAPKASSTAPSANRTKEVNTKLRCRWWRAPLQLTTPRAGLQLAYLPWSPVVTWRVGATLNLHLRGRESNTLRRALTWNKAPISGAGCSFSSKSSQPKMRSQKRTSGRDPKQITF